MISIPKHLSQIIGKAARKAMPGLTDPVSVTAEQNKEWDYVCPSAMKFFNMHKKKGSFGFASCLDMAKAIAENIDAENNAIEKVDLAQIGKGDPSKSGFFLNITLKNSFIENQVRNVYLAQKVELAQQQDDEENKEEDKKQRVIVDFSSPNIAKNMHVGHLRSTIQGDSICRVFEFLGHDVKRVNHVGDWGTQFGMLIAELDDNFPSFTTDKPEIADLQTFYQNAKKRFDAEPEFKERAHANVVKLQSGDAHCTDGWKMLCALSRVEFQKIYDRLDINVEEVGESFYNPMLAPMIEELLEKKIAVENDGAICVFVPKQKVPLIIRKSDGGFNYDTTDMACIRYRANDLKGDRLIYVTDIGQEFHFKLVFAGGIKADFYDPKKTQVNHMPFGMVLQETIGEDKDGEVSKKVEKIKTREGKSVKLAELLDEAKNRAIKMFQDRMEN